MATKPKSKEEEHDDDQPQILPILQELNDEQVASDTREYDKNTEPSMQVNEEVKAERRRLSFQAMNESSESDLTPSPSKTVQRRRLKVTHVSSSSEDIKTESPDSSDDDEEFIRKQIMGMVDEEEMSLSDDEKGNYLANEGVDKESELDNTTVTTKPLLREDSIDNEENSARKISLPKTDTSTAQVVPETLPSTTFRKAIPVMKQRQSTDEEVESITESLSKGSSSVQVSSFTPGSSPTSASSLEEDSDSSPSHRKVSGDKRHRKDLKITQCSSGEEEDDSLAEDYGVGISSDITPSDDSDTKEDPSMSPTLFNSTVYANPSDCICHTITCRVLATIACHNWSSTV
ncbi:protein piccolo-like [Platichthys flesus]|uniref:protein piccolo-like n=1 Tax=Platichthys flesus TaxID=8260 RepID=UPI002DB972DC|nr:protein piccolo-like [Platichthys flesus]